MKEQEQPKEMKLQKVDVGVWVKASEELPEGINKEKLSIKYKGKPDTLVYLDNVWYWTDDINSINFKVDKDSWWAIEWLKPLKDRYILTEKELKIIWDASLNYYKSEYKMEKDTANNQMKPQPNFTQFIKSITNGK